MDVKRERRSSGGGGEETDGGGLHVSFVARILYISYNEANLCIDVSKLVHHIYFLFILLHCFVKLS